jgi:hypothetical protein
VADDEHVHQGGGKSPTLVSGESSPTVHSTAARESRKPRDGSCACRVALRGSIIERAPWTHAIFERWRVLSDNRNVCDTTQ